jgi:SNF2 family DNA or RNA helicase
MHCPEKHNIWTWKVDSEKTLDLNDSKLTFILMNVEALSHKSGQKWLEKLLSVVGLRSLMVVDESTTIKNRTARRTKSIIKLGKLVRFKRILTGSPVTKSPLDLFTQCYFLDWKLLGYESFYPYRSRYAVMHSMEMNGRQIMFPKYYTNLEELEHKLKNFSYRVRKKDCLDLPPKTYVQRYIDLTDEQRKVYNDLKRKALALVQDETISYTNKLTEVLKLHQITCGFYKTDEGTITSFKSNPKLNELLNILEETEDKCIIWANYIFNIKMIKQKLEETYGKDSVVSIYGEDSIKVRNDAVENFQHNDRCRFLVGNPTVGGYGLTLTAARYVIYYSNNYNLEVRQQSEDRAHRYGQTAQVTYVDLIANKSIDEMILNSLEGKIEISAKTLGEEAQKWL